MTKRFSVPRGTTDILPQEMCLWQEVESKARRIFQNYNYKEIRTPLFEETGLFARSMGATSDVVQKQMLNLQSQRQGDADDIEQGGFSLRPEGTASVARAYIQNGMDRKESISKLFYIGPMFRGERPQKGRLRQFHQIGAEVIGAGTLNPYIDAEVIALNVDILKSFGLKNFQLKINTLGSAEDKERFSKLLREELKSEQGNLCEDCQNRFDRNVFRILDCKNRKCQETLKDVNIGYSYLSEESAAYFVQVKKTLDSLGVVFGVDPGLVRGLDYYTHTVFEISDSSLGSQDALSAGGRYSDLVSHLGGPQVDAVGFALGIERALLAMPSKAENPASRMDAYIIALNEAVFPKAFQILKRLRSEGISSDISYKVSSVKSQMRSANKAAARQVVILGEEEEKKNVVTLKDMEDGNQQEVDLENLVNILKRRKV